MKKVLVLVVAMMLVLSSVAYAADNTAKLLGVWEADMGDEGVMRMTMGANGFGTYALDGQEMGQFAFLVRGSIMASAMIAEDGSVLFGAEEITFVDETTVSGMEDGVEMIFKRIEAPEVAEITLSNAFLGTWVADLPEVAGMVMEYKADGTYAYKGGEYEGECSYLVIGDTMISLTDEGECENFTFTVVDENNMDVTEVATGAVARFIRESAAEDAA